ncbi:MAG: CDP-alcohol phosphatidyltransferase family protein [Myxococcaceae bacterium]
MSAPWLNLPNSITLVRLGLVPVFLVLHLSGRAGWALAVFVTASISDSLDGFLARVLNQRSKVGAVLDPVADKLLVFTALVSLVYEEQLPIWLLGLIVFRDLSMIVGAIVVKKKHLEIPTAPTRIGKYATFFLIGLIVLALSSQSEESALLGAYADVVGFIAALCVTVSTLQYFYRHGYLFFAPAKPA